jgi:hypothetical protein
VLKKEIKVLPGHPQKTNIFCSVMWPIRELEMFLIQTTVVRQKNDIFA